MRSSRPSSSAELIEQTAGIVYIEEKKFSEACLKIPLRNRSLKSFSAPVRQTLLVIFRRDLSFDMSLVKVRKVPRAVISSRLLSLSRGFGMSLFIVGSNTVHALEPRPQASVFGRNVVVVRSGVLRKRRIEESQSAR
jgi:hypothetical protein